MATHSSIHAWEISRTNHLVGYVRGVTELDTTEATEYAWMICNVVLQV